MKMRLFNSKCVILYAGVLAASLASFAQTQLYTNLHTFTGLDGANPRTELVEASDGALYGVCAAGGTSNLGTMFRLNRDGSGFAVLHHFGGPSDGATPGGLIEASDGAFYGTTRQGGTSNFGTVFRLDKTTSNYVVLCSLTDSRNPYKGVIEGSDGVLYGTSHNGGLYSYSYGTAFALNKDGSGFVMIHSFNSTLYDGFFPIATVLEASDGRLYGTTSDGGLSMGTLYGLNKDGSNFQVVYSFRIGTASGYSPYAGLLEGTDGALYGTTLYCPSPGSGTIFKINKDGTGFNILHTFGQGYANDGGLSDAGLLQASDGFLYGTTQYGGTSGGPNGAGVIFKLANDGTGYAVIHNFGSIAGDGQQPFAFPREGADGALYGTTSLGGAGYGTVYRLTGPGSPLLSIRLSGTNTAIISWPSPGTEFHLEQSADLASPAWIPVAQTPMNDGKTNSLTIPLTSTSMVYRLKSQ